MALAFVLEKWDIEDVSVGGGVGFGEDGAALGLVVLVVLVPGSTVKADFPAFCIVPGNSVSSCCICRTDSSIRERTISAEVVDNYINTKSQHENIHK
ncbi:MAG: hypothetical protein IJK75_03635 [Bacteroidales bacterium]|nr:hypothetical protein [Bacteroidales bacterium]